MISDVTANGRGTVQVELLPGAHKRAKLASLLANKRLKDFLSEAVDVASQEVFRQRGMDGDGNPLPQSAPLPGLADVSKRARSRRP